MAQNKLFNVLTCYGMGFQYNDVETKLPSRAKGSEPIQDAQLDEPLLPGTDYRHEVFLLLRICHRAQQEGRQDCGGKTQEACYCRFTRA